jgi:DNA-directed RNA polymerase specialized sigma24 family protein
MVGRDARLVFEVAVEGFSQAEVAARCGLSHSATRKRYQRAKWRLRETLEFV